MDANIPNIILFWYDGSVFSRKMDYYLSLRGLPYQRCVQPPMMPRPDLARLGINYRRIPLLAIGRDVYCDTRIIIEKLETLLPDGALGSRVPFEQALERIIEAWVIDAGPFWRTAGCLPLDAPFLQDPAWMKDRADGSGGAFNLEALRHGRTENLAHLRMYYETAEKLLEDGRDYLFATDSPRLGDIHAIWSFDWGLNLQLHAARENVAENVINEATFPRVCAWVERFRQAYEAASARQPPATIASEAAISAILSADVFEAEGSVDMADPLAIHKGQRVTVRPTDFGFTHSDTGALLALSSREVVVESEVPDGHGSLRLHFPRNNFRIEPTD